MSLKKYTRIIINNLIYFFLLLIISNLVISQTSVGTIFEWNDLYMVGGEDYVNYLLTYKEIEFVSAILLSFMITILFYKSRKILFRLIELKKLK